MQQISKHKNQLRGKANLVKAVNFIKQQAIKFSHLPKLIFIRSDVYMNNENSQYAK